MKKLMNALKKLAAVCVIFMLLVTVFVYLHHVYQLSKEEALLKLQGKYVNIHDKKINVYSEGSGEDTYVYMPGSGIAAPIYEMKGLYSKFSKNNRIAVIERGGYGYSDVFDDNRNLDTIMTQTRRALLQSGHKPPYILVPHSLSGLEAIYWAQKYPNEITAIIALDIGLPQEYKTHPPDTADSLMIKGMSLLTKIGFHRLAPSMVYDPEVIKQSFLTEDEKKQFKALSYKQIFNDNMVQELLQSGKNAVKSTALPLPNETPMLFVSAYTEENKHSIFTKAKNKNYEAFSQQLKNVQIKKIEGKHSIYLYAPDDIYQSAVQFSRQIKHNR
ncbi:alpha/beta hydrolase [Domibacillus robiginosus]|uniref:alpha/beta hydrolase n=1 Tax=Domibacillus robiginosus TaxID=1071054 RepID=UPI00067CA621|nr:alpha/beta hydrolase [Domibacillus robiginosus]